MKSIFQKIFLLILGLSMLSACGDKLNVEPQQSISAESAVSNADNIETIVKGLYSQLQHGRLYGSYLNLYAELLAEPAANEVNFSGTFADLRNLWQKNQVANNATAEVTWREAYQTIRMANTVIDNVSKVTDQNLQKRLLGEAQLIRAMMYFELVRFYAKPWNANGTNNQLGVPLILKGAPANSADITSDEYPVRASVTAVYDQIIKDLEAAELVLPNTADRWRATKHVATAFLARVYLQQGKYAQAATKANTVIGSGRFALVEDVVGVFNQSANTSEDIFAIQQTSQSEATDGDCVTFYASLPGIGRADMDIRPGHTALYQATDLRRTKLFYVGTGRRAGRLRSGKWRTQYSNINVIRLAEMYLVRAESNLRTNSSLGASPLSDINRIRQRAGIAPLSTVAVADILMERRLELAWEGHRLHDIKRTQGTVGTRPYDDPKLVLPIPIREMDVNKMLVQNEGY